MLEQFQSISCVNEGPCPGTLEFLYICDNSTNFLLICKPKYQLKTRFSVTKLLSKSEAYFYIVDGKWGTWGNWSICSKTCDLGTQRRIRECNNPSPKYGGNFCHNSAHASHSTRSLSIDHHEPKLCSMYESMYQTCIQPNCPSKYYHERILCCVL